MSDDAMSWDQNNPIFIHLTSPMMAADGTKNLLRMTHVRCRDNPTIIFTTLFLLEYYRLLLYFIDLTKMAIIRIQFGFVLYQFAGELGKYGPPLV